MNGNALVSTLYDESKHELLAHCVAFRRKYIIKEVTYGEPSLSQMMGIYPCDILSFATSSLWLW